MIINKYKNGNATIEIHNDGTRIIDFENELNLEYPLNIDIRVSTKCSFGMRDYGTYVMCSFCHEEAKVNGKECDYEILKDKLKDLPQGIELAIGSNNLTTNLIEFLVWCKSKQYICNLTINQGHINRDYKDLKYLIDNDIIKGLGISYRENIKFNIPQDLLDYENMVFHVIAGIDDINSIKELSNKGVKKILVLGEKDFGFNKGKVDLNAKKHKQWLYNINKLFNLFSVVSFDNLGIEQLRIKRFFNDKTWEQFYQGEYSMYINAVEQYFAPSSRNDNKTDFDNINIKEYFKTLWKNN